MNINFVVLSIWNLLTSNSLIQLFPDFNRTPRIVEGVIYFNVSFPLNTCSPWTMVCPGPVPFSKKVSKFRFEHYSTTFADKGIKKNKIYYWPAFPPQNERLLRCFVKIILLEWKFLI
jgi:hypothetical protein